MATVQRCIGRWRRLKRRAANESGATAIEFAMVGVPFFILFCGMIELALIFMMSVSLENSLVTLSRTIRTGELQTSGGSTSANFIQTVCNGLGWMQTDCKSKLHLDVRTYSSMASTNGQGAPITNGTWNTGTPCFLTGGPGDIVLVRAYYEWALIAPGFDKALQKLSNGATVISAATTFRNEPYGATVPPQTCPP